MILQVLTTMERKPWVTELGTLVVLLLCPLALPVIGLNADIASRILIWGLFGLGFDILFGYTGLLSFGQAAFFGVGGFASAYLMINMNVDIFVALGVGTVLAMLAGVVVGYFTLRRSGIYFAMITLAFGEMFYFLELSPLSDFTGGENGITGVPLPVLFGHKLEGGWELFLFIAAFFLVSYVIAHRIVLSPFGRVLTALRDNSPRALASGHAVRNYKWAAFVIAAGFGGIAGGLLGVLQSYMPPDAVAFHTSGQLVMQGVIGGAGTLFGPLLGAIVWLGLQDNLQTIPALGPAWKLILGVVFVVLIMAFRRGLLGELRQYLHKRAHMVPEGEEPAEEPPRTMEEKRERRIAGTPEASSVPWIVPHAKSKDVPALECRHLTKRYGGIVANRDVSMAIQEGELRGIIGPNGAGKSTFFKMLAGEIEPSEGQIFLHGADITNLGVTAVAQLGMSKSYQINQLFSKLTVRENLAIPVLARIRGQFRPDMLKALHKIHGLEAQIEATLDLVDLGPRANVPVTDLAYGEKRRLEIGLALANSPNVLLLDEPLAGMSPAERASTVKLLQEIREGRTLVVVEHDMDAVFELAEYITVLQEGQLLAEGTPDQIREDSRVQEAYLGGMDENETETGTA
ncbi:MAG TPA: branched-chain amino acid ABC transporter ATP-binding protein/permease [Gammaproteobacteria bacterium]|nr:branched-chain amino acid ABC transporter ATP-binding protein/permease [Gammaproteobacteria bacterium]